jgi:DNA-directed RNA polymerase subunit H (RpoH/RPB5)|uniref:RNA polymerase subunit H/Rpb5 C-terminal domain-containing protein n=1 Tax=viral metagenome TaxID=1070528 RepID=A0A6C0LCV3_9ZZZZ
MDIEIINKNIEDMLVNRGDDVSSFKEILLSLSKEDFESDKLVINVQTLNTTILYALSKNLRKNIINELKEKLKDGDNIKDFTNKYGGKNNIILVFNNESISTAVKSQLNKYDKIFQKNGGHLQYFSSQQLMFNPTKHEYVPKHTKLTEEEVKDFMKEYLARSKMHMHVILQNDPIAKWIGLKHGDIVRIDRYNENSGESFSYRSCI